MPKLTQSVPKYAKHRRSGQAVVQLEGRTIYLGPHGSKASLLAYDQLIAEWLAAGRRLPQEQREDAITITELCIRYFEFAKSYYVKHGVQTGEVEAIRRALRMLRGLYPDLPAAEFGPLKLKAVRESMIRADWCRKHINKQVSRIRRMFAWGASEELVPGTLVADLRTVSGLKQGRSAARETPRVKPVPLDVVHATLPHLLAIPADMVRVQLLTGCRPNEVCIIRPADIDQSKDVWIYRPQEHKTEHVGKDRVIFLGPEAQAVLRPYLLRSAKAYCFSPAEALEQQRRAKRLNRKTPIKYEKRKPKSKPRWKPRDHYHRDSYRRAIHRACDLAFPAPEDLDEHAAKQWRSEHRWSPNRLRHAAATLIREQFGLEGAQVILGHSHADVTQVYAELNMQRGFEIAQKLG